MQNYLQRNLQLYKLLSSKVFIFAIGFVLQMCDTITTLFGMSLNDKKEIKRNFNGFFLFARVHGKENSFDLKAYIRIALNLSSM